MERQSLSNQQDTDCEIKAGFENLVHKNVDGHQELFILIGGVHCAGCIQKIESTLAKEQDIQKARLNFSTRRLSIGWKGDKARANVFVDLIENLGYSVKPYDPKTERDDTEKQDRFLLLCLGVAGFAMGNIMLLSMGLWISTGETMGHATREFLHLIAAVIGVPAVMFSGRPFFRSAAKALRHGHTNMDVPISLALILATSMSFWETFNGGEHVYFDSAVMLVFFLLIGRYLDFKARKNARSTATDLVSTLSGFAVVFEGGKAKRIPIRDLRENMIVQVAAGASFPVDGILFEGATSVDTSLVTGETVPREICKDDKIYAGTLNISQSVKIRVEKAAEDSMLADVVRLMEKAEQSQASYVRLADRAAKLYTPIVHTLALGAFLGWLFLCGVDWQEALLIAVTVLIITCPCALGLAVPVTQVLATGRLMKNGILLKSGDALERLSKIDLVVFDKTGTLTLGKPILFGEYDDHVLQKAASLASHSAHPLSKSILQSFNGELLDIKNVQELAGKGLQAELERKVIKLGSRNWCGGSINSNKEDFMELWFREEGQEPIRFTLKDQLREDSSNLVQALKDSGLKTILLSGDIQNVVQQVASKISINEMYSEKTPPEKYQILESYRNKSHCILMVGDGLNDAPAMAYADVSMAPGTAIDMAQNAADIIFMGDKIMPVFETYQTARLSQKLVKQNFALAILYNICVIPIALAGLVTPMIAAIAMSGSSLIVIANSFRIKWNS